MPRGLNEPTPPPARRPPSRMSRPRPESQSTDTRSSSTLNPIPPPPTRQRSSRNRGPTLEDFLHPERINRPPHHIQHHRDATPAEQTMYLIEETRDCFAMFKKAEGDLSLQEIILRSAAIDIFDEALAVLKKRPEDHVRIASEAERKISVTLGVMDADADDMVFMNGQLLKPIEPQYANPRIPGPMTLTEDKKKKEKEDHDNYKWHAQSRLEAWRTDGWPATYPENAINAETRKGGKLVTERKTVRGGDRDSHRVHTIKRMSNEAVREKHTGKTHEQLGGIVEKPDLDGEVASRVEGVRKKVVELPDGEVRYEDFDENYDSDDWT